MNIKKFLDYIKEDYNPNYQLSLFDEPNTSVDIVQQLVNHYTCAKREGESQIKNGDDALKFLMLNSQLDELSLMTYFMKWKLESDNLNLIIRKVLALFPQIDSNLVAKSTDLITDNKDKSKILDVFKFLDIKACDFVSKYYGAALNKSDYKSMLSFIKDNMHKETILIYRAVLLPSGVEELSSRTLNNKHGFGKYWTHNINKAEAYDGVFPTDEIERDAERLVIIEAEARWADVNWGATLAKSFYYNSSENEIELYSSSTPLIVSSMFYHFGINKRRASMFNNIVGAYIRNPIMHPDYVSVGHNANRTDVLD